MSDASHSLPSCVGRMRYHLARMDGRLANERTLNLFAEAGLTHESLDQAWAASPYLSPLLGYIAARLPDPVAFDVCCSFFRAVAREVEIEPASIELLESVRAGTTAERNRAATALCGLRNDATLDGDAHVAALADAVEHFAEVWADPDSTDPENDPILRARAATNALVAAMLSRAGLSLDDKQARRRATEQLLVILRTVVPTPP